MYPASRYNFEINKQIVLSGPVQFLAGSLALGTDFSHTITTTNNISYTVDGRVVLIQRGTNGATRSIDSNLSSRCLAMKNDLQTLSNQLATLANTSGSNISIPTSVAAPLLFYVNNVDVNGLAVFYINGNTALNSPLIQAICIIIESAVVNTIQLVVINLSGTSVSFTQGNVDGTWLPSTTGKSKTNWNFNQVTSISLARNILGPILALYAAVNTNVNIDGVTAEVRDPPITLPSWI